MPARLARAQAAAAAAVLGPTTSSKPKSSTKRSKQLSSRRSSSRPPTDSSYGQAQIRRLRDDLDHLGAIQHPSPDAPSVRARRVDQTRAYVGQYASVRRG